jgi:hypothetical protein
MSVWCSYSAVPVGIINTFLVGARDAAADEDLRVIDESGEDYLYPASYFAPIKVPAAVEESLLRAS